MKHQISQTYHIQCARRLSKLPPHHPCSQVHGNTFVITFDFVGDLDHSKGWLEDYHTLKEYVLPVLEELDHRNLNDIPGLENPTTELLCQWIFQRVTLRTSLLNRIHISEIPGTLCSYPAPP